MMAASLEQRAQRRAARANAREAKRFPLLAHAGLVATKTAEQAADELEAFAVDLEAHWRRIEAGRRRSAAEGLWMRAFVATVVTPEQLAELDRRRGAGPDDPVYTHDFWGQRLREVAPDIATACGYPPVRPAWPLNLVVARDRMRNDPEYRRQMEAFCEEQDARLRRRRGGDQLDLPEGDA